MPREDLILEPNYRRGTASQWATADPPAQLAEREVGVETDTMRRKRGPGMWNSLPYLVPKMFFGSGPPGPTIGGINDTYLDYDAVTLYAAKTASGWGGSIRLRSITSATVTALAAGASPTVSLDNATGVLALGIPAGTKGDTGTAGQSVTGVAVTTLAAGGTATASYNAGTGVMSLGIPRGTAGTNGTNGTNGQSVASVTATTVAAGGTATAAYNAGTGSLSLGIPTGATGSVALITATVSATIPLVILGQSSSITLTVPGATTAMVPNVAPTDPAFAASFTMTPPVVSAANTVTFKLNALLGITAGTKSFLVK